MCDCASECKIDAWAEERISELKTFGDYMNRELAEVWKQIQFLREEVDELREHLRLKREEE